MFSIAEILLKESFESTIQEAIQNGWLLRITYMGLGGNRPRKRVVEPFTLGTFRGNPVMVAWHNRGFSLSRNEPPWRMYRLDRMYQCTLEKANKIPGSNPPKGFRVNRPGYKPSDSRLDSITDDIIDHFQIQE